MSNNNTYSILVVDDEPTNVAILNAMLNGHYKIKVALSGQDAFKVASALPAPDLILLDVVMEGMDGFEVCRRLKAQISTQNIPIIFVTAHNDVKHHRKGLELGALDFFEKPYSAPLLIKRITNHLRTLELERDNQDSRSNPELQDSQSCSD